MKRFYTSAALLLISSLSFAQTLIPIDTTQGRYWSALFPTVNVTTAVVYGSSVTVNNSTQSLLMNIYQPVGDTVSQRPVLVIAHGGSFSFGSRTDVDVVAICTRFAKMGYVCASIDYRLGLGFPIDSIGATKAVVRAVQDMKAAVRFFRKDFFTNGNSYKIHPNYIFAGGSSAGAFMGLHLAYLDQNSEIPNWPGLSTWVAAQGGLDGNSGNPGYSHHINGVINLCGALGDSTWMETNDIPCVSLHGPNDQTVPYGTAMIYLFSTPVLVVDGSASIYVRAQNTGTPNSFYTFNGADHVPYAGTNATQVAYMDTTERFVKIFLRPLLVQPSTTGIHNNVSNASVNVYPNPSNGDVYISTESFGNYKTQLMDLTGKIVTSFNVTGSLYHFSTAGITPGVYFLRMESNEGIITKKIVLK